MKLIIGLGNPGKEYEKTRHNVGYMMVDNLIKEWNLGQGKQKLGGLYYEIILKNEKIVILKPQEYINLSGQVIKRFIDFYKIPIKDLFIFHDDLDIPCGAYKIRASGGSAGHNGLKDIETNLQTKDYQRMKIGISNNKQIETKNYVLGKFSKEEQEKLNQIISLGPKIIEDFLDLSFSNLMSKYNG